MVGFFISSNFFFYFFLFACSELYIRTRLLYILLLLNETIEKCIIFHGYVHGYICNIWEAELTDE